MKKRNVLSAIISALTLRALEPIGNFDSGSYLSKKPFAAAYIGNERTAKAIMVPTKSSNRFGFG